MYSFKIILLKTSFVAILKDSIISQESTSGNFSIEERQTKTKIFSFPNMENLKGPILHDLYQLMMAIWWHAVSFEKEIELGQQNLKLLYQ